MVDGFKQIMLPIDFSEHCDRTAEYAAWFATVSGGTIHLVHVIANPADPFYEPQAVVHWELVEHAEKKARAEIEAAAHRCLPAACRWKSHIFHGDPYEHLMKAADELKPDIIVMSSHGRGGVLHLVIGSVNEKMVRHAPCPVLVVR